MSRNQGRQGMIRRLWLVGSFSLLLSTFVTGSVSAAQDVDLHSLNWYVHVDLVTVTEDLAYWQNVLDEALVSANALIEGGQGPADTACCSRVASAGSLATFGTAGDGFDVIDSVVELNALNSFGGAGSNAYLVDTLMYCSGPGTSIAGCASQPSCSFNPNDDPNLWMAVTASSFDSGTLPAVIAHERGHNACLSHVATHACQVMQGTIFTPGLGGCFTAAECSRYEEGRTTATSGLACGCHAAGGGLEVDGMSCSDFVGGLCSGGLCGDPAGEAAVKLIVSAHPGSAGIPAPDDALTVSALSGDWTNLGQISPSAEDFHGLAYASDSSTLFGVIPTSGDDLIMSIDADTGDRIATVGSIANGTAEVISMAYHPGATSSPSDDRLVMLEVAASSGTLIWVDPASPSVRNVYGSLLVGPAEFFTGLAYDSINGRLFASSPFNPGGLYEFDLSSCPPSPCNHSAVAGATDLFAEDGSLSFSAATGMLYQVAPAFSGQRTFYNVIDPTTATTSKTLSLDVFTPGGLAAVPEPSLVAGLGVGCLGLIGARRRVRRYSQM